MSGKTVRAYLRELLREIDWVESAPRLRRAAVALAIPVASLTSACSEEAYPIIATPMYGVPEYGAPFAETSCSNTVDDDYDGLSDCHDVDCQGLEICIACFDGIDNDGDGLADCSDASCAPGEACVGECDDGVDDDEDGLLDCADPECSEVPPCSDGA